MNTTTTELDAINTMLVASGSAPVNRLTDTGQDVIVARQVLNEVVREIQAEEYHFNTEEGLVFHPDEDGNITVGANITRVFNTKEDSPVQYVTKKGGVSGVLDLTLRGHRLYDKTNHTYTFTRPVTSDVTLLLPFDELPLEARTYAIVRATRKYIVQTLGDTELEQWTAQDELRARNAMIAADTRQAASTLGGMTFVDPLMAVRLSRY